MCGCRLLEKDWVEARLSDAVQDQPSASDAWPTQRSGKEYRCVLFLPGFPQHFLAGRVNALIGSILILLQCPPEPGRQAPGQRNRDGRKSKPRIDPRRVWAKLELNFRAGGFEADLLMRPDLQKGGLAYVTGSGGIAMFRFQQNWTAAREKLRRECREGNGTDCTLKLRTENGEFDFCRGSPTCMSLRTRPLHPP